MHFLESSTAGRAGCRQAHLQGSSSEVNARTRDGLRLEANKHVRPEAVVHVIPKKTKQHRLELQLAGFQRITILETQLTLLFFLLLH